MSAGSRKARATLGHLGRRAHARWLQPKGTCSSGKVRWPDEDTARAALAKRLMSATAKAHETRCYECDRCGGWHLTSRRRWSA